MLLLLFYFDSCMREDCNQQLQTGNVLCRLILIHACARIATANMHRFLCLFLFIHTIFFSERLSVLVYIYAILPYICSMHP